MGQKYPNSPNHPKLTQGILFWLKTSKTLKNSWKHAKWTKPSKFCPWNKVLPIKEVEWLKEYINKVSGGESELIGGQGEWSQGPDC